MKGIVQVYYSQQGEVMKIDEYVKTNRVRRVVQWGDEERLIFENLPHITCGDGLVLSVQASREHYCDPTGNVDEYRAFEIMIIKGDDPKEFDPFFSKNDGLYINVPADVVDKTISRHGGMINTHGSSLVAWARSIIATIEDVDDAESIIAGIAWVIPPVKAAVSATRDGRMTPAIETLSHIVETTINGWEDAFDYGGLPPARFVDRRTIERLTRGGAGAICQKLEAVNAAVKDRLCDAITRIESEWREEMD